MDITNPCTCDSFSLSPSLTHTHTYIQSTDAALSVKQSSEELTQDSISGSFEQQSSSLSAHSSQQTWHKNAPESKQLQSRLTLTVDTRRRNQRLSSFMTDEKKRVVISDVFTASSCNSCSAMVFILSLTNQGGCVLLTTPLTPIHNSFIYWGLAYSGFSLFSLSLFWKIAFGYLVFWPNFNILWVNYKFCCTCVVQNANESFQF